jgi:hypothetical protein
MQRKLAFLLNVVLFGGLTSSLRADRTPLEKIAITGLVGGLLYGGNKAQQMNEEYSKKHKKPDMKMRLTKTALAAGTIVGMDILLGDNDTKQNLVKLGALSLGLAAATEPVANVVRQVPIIGGLLTDPVDEEGEEIKDFGAIARFAVVYVPLREAGLKIFCSKAPQNQSSKKPSSNPLYEDIYELL